MATQAADPERLLRREVAWLTSENAHLHARAVALEDARRDAERRTEDTAAAAREAAAEAEGVRLVMTQRYTKVECALSQVAGALSIDHPPRDPPFDWIVSCIHSFLGGGQMQQSFG
jgi:hypothetical protein